MNMAKQKKDCMFQYGKRHGDIISTDLITLAEAEELWNKHLDDVKENWDEFSSPEMCIWTNCSSNIDYNTQEKDIDFRDCELINGRFWRVKKEEVK